MGYRIDLGDGLAAMSKYPEKVFDLVYAGLWNNISRGEMATMAESVIVLFLQLFTWSYLITLDILPLFD